MSKKKYTTYFSILKMTLTLHIHGNNFEIPHIKQNQNLKEYFGGDIQKFSSKLPGFIWSKYSGGKTPSWLRLFRTRNTSRH